MIRLAIKERDHHFVYERLLEYPSFVNAQDKNGKMPLHYAVESGQIDMIRMIIERGARLDCEDGNGETALCFMIKKGMIFSVFKPHRLPVDILKNFSYIYLALKEGRYELFLRLCSFLERFEKTDILKLVSLAVQQGNYFIMKEFLCPHLSEEEREKFLKETLKNICIEGFRDEFEVFCKLRKMTLSVLMELYQAYPRIIEWLNFDSYFWSSDSKMDFLEFVMKDNPDLILTLNGSHKSHLGGWGYVASFLWRLLNSQIPIRSLTCPRTGTALSALINERCLLHNTFDGDDDVILKLIERGMGVNEDTPIGKPLNHYLYMLSYDWNRLESEEKKSSMILVHALLKTYEKNESLTGMALNPKVAELMHHGAVGDLMGEYMQTPLGSTLVIGHPSKDLYDEVKLDVDFEEINDHRRNFIHHLAFLEECFEYHLERLFLLRHYTSEDFKRQINLQDNDGMTPLMYATRNREFFLQLLMCGADVTLTDKRGFSVVHHLMIHGKDDVIRAFLEWNRTFVSFECCGVPLKRKLGVRMDDRLTLGVTFLEQFKRTFETSKNTCFSRGATDI